MVWMRPERPPRDDSPTDAPTAATDGPGPVEKAAKALGKKAAKAVKKAKKAGTKSGLPSTPDSTTRGAPEPSDVVSTPDPGEKAEGKAKSKPKSKPKAKSKKHLAAVEEVSAAEVDRLVDEGMMIVRSALRMSAKNRLIVQVLGSGDPFDEDALLDALRDDARALAEEKSEDAVRLETEATKASKRPGRASYHDDYRRQDVRALALRERVNHETARRLHALSEDDTTLRELITAAREAALDDVLQARLMAVMPFRRDPAYVRERGERMRSLVDDLAVLRRRQKARLGDKIH